MKKLPLALALIVGVSAPAYAVEINTDVGCDSAGSWMPDSGWAVTGSKCIASSATRMAMLMQMSTAILKNHRYKITFDVSGVTGTGKLRAFAGVKMPTSPTGTWITAASVSAVADNFTTSNGLQAGGILRSTTGPGDDPERNGSWRISCISGGFKRVDPMVYPGTQAPHLHELVGATNMEPNWTYNDFRTKAQSSCSNPSDPQNTINRSGYWFPAVLDGNGNAKKTGPLLVYYKGPSDPAQPSSVALTGSISGTTLTVTATGGVTNPISPDGEFITGTGITAGTQIVSQLTGTSGGIGTYQLNNSMTVGSETITLISPYKAAGETQGTAASMCAEFSPTATCQNVPRSLRFTFGYKGSFNATSITDNNCGPADTVSVGSSTTERCSIRGISGAWQCAGGPNGEGGQPAGTQYGSAYSSLQEIMDAHVCALGGRVTRSIGMPSCWDGTNVDAPNHRDHISWGNNIVHCLSAHAVKLPQISLLLSYTVDQSFLDGKWKLSSDEMAACYDTGGQAGCTEHADYWEAWSDSVRTRWFANCNMAHNSCTNDLGDGFTQKVPHNQWGPDAPQIFGHSYQMDDATPPENFGMSKDITANGSYTVYLTAPDDGVWGFMGLKNFSGSIDNIHVTDLGVTAKGPVTVHN
jgi:hypothetical protein